MNKLILTIDIQNYILKNINIDITTLLLKKAIFEGVTNKEIAEQILSKKKSQKKLPTWFNSPNVYYPSKLTIEQTSSEKTALYKSEIVYGERLLDMTGGFGVDTYYFSKKVKSVLHCEISNNLSEIASHNYDSLNIKNIQCLPIDGINYLETTDEHFDWIYVDPSRRNNTKGKVFQLADCTPNVSKYLDLLFTKSKNVMVKTSPILDLTIGIKELQYVKEIHIISVSNEVKELLWILEGGYTREILVKTIDIGKQSSISFNFHLIDEKSSIPNYSEPRTYLYEPNAAILKSGGFKNLANYFGVYKLHENTHLYTSDKLLNFPGRCFRIDKVFRYKDKEIKKEGVKKANITIRNFPLTVEQLRKKHKIGDGGSIYLFFCTIDIDSLIVIKCYKL